MIERIISGLAVILIGVSLYSLFAEPVETYFHERQKDARVDAFDSFVATDDFSAVSVANRTVEAVDAKLNYRQVIDTALPKDGTTPLGVLSIDAVGLEEPVYKGPATDAQLDVGVSLVEDDESLIDQNIAIAGHRVEGADIHFNQLQDAEIGMEASFRLTDHTRTYKITRIQSVDPGDTDILAEYDGPDRLTLITCDDYDAKTGLFMTRTVFTAELVDVMYR